MRIIGGVLFILVMAFANLSALAESYKYKREDLEKLKTTGNCVSCYLRGAKLKGLDLSGADLKMVKLNNSNLTGVNLSGADLFAADFTNAKMRGLI